MGHIEARNISVQRLKKTKIIGSVFLWVFVGTALSAALFLLAKSVRGPSPVLADEAAKARKSQGGSKVPDVDLRKHSVDLKDVLFDTFNGSFLRLSDASRSQILSLRDAIRPIYKPPTPNRTPCSGFGIAIWFSAMFRRAGRAPTPSRC